ncbi:MAG TPA: SPOR domain-containing protein [Thermoanaerobaculia bacterium]|nr:SPOR domain-containing protein [Thermoanaerobaculia bacterium]
MTQSEDRSYYEISLTSGQVLLAFGVLLACVLGAFVSGMWVARESLEDTEPAASERGVDEGEPTDTLDFFDANARGSSGSAAPAGGEPPAASESAPASQEAESRQIQQVKPVPPARAAQSPPTEPPSERAAAATEIPDESAEIPDESAETPADADADAEAEPESAPVAGAEMAGIDTDRREPVSGTSTEAGGSPTGPTGQAGFVIQVFSSSDEAQAEALVRRLRGSGYSSFRTSESVSGRTVHRVRVGPYADRPAAEREAEMLKRDFKLDTWVTASG